VFLVGGALVEFWWPGVIACVAAWFYCRRPSWMALAVWVGALSALYVINRNLGALLALPVIFGASQIRLRLPRVKWFFYLFYPAHLAALWMIR
ncbi:MAG: conjugal transfer protein TraX, partial [Cutibacterium acnes]|nr:conjugal transfer protein TraX [Cutibacterium acnes]